MPYEIHIHIPEGQLEQSIKKLTDLGFSISGMDTIPDQARGMFTDKEVAWLKKQKSGTPYHTRKKKKKLRRKTKAKAQINHIEGMPKEGTQEHRVIVAAQSFGGNPFTSKDILEALGEDSKSMRQAIWRTASRGFMPPGYRKLTQAEYGRRSR